MRLTRTLVAFSFVAVTFLASARAAFEPPKDGVMTEKQVTAYLQVMKEAVATWKAQGKALEGNSANAATAMAMIAASDARFKASLAKAGLSEEEYRWVSEKVWEARGALIIVDVGKKAREQLADAVKKNQADQAAAKQKVAQYDAAIKSGRKVLSDDERKSIVESAKSDEQSALDDAKQHDTEAKSAADEAAKHDAEAKAADALAARPPADISADDRPGYISDRKQEAQTARDAAKESRQKEAEERKASTEARTKAAAANSRQKNPDLPSVEEAVDVKKANEAGLDQAKAESQQLADAAKLIQETGVQLEKQFAETLGKIPKQNVEVMQKHAEEMDAIWK